MYIYIYHICNTLNNIDILLTVLEFIPGRFHLTSAAAARRPKDQWLRSRAGNELNLSTGGLRPTHEMVTPGCTLW